MMLCRGMHRRMRRGIRCRARLAGALCVAAAAAAQPASAQDNLTIAAEQRPLDLLDTISDPNLDFGVHVITLTK